ncbi:hypothetical protein ATCC90586_009124 [Pythium insidiosum]|nr:hypothetical protein ATCC90586_009124 [Pythium insidiosum]
MSRVVLVTLVAALAVFNAHAAALRLSLPSPKIVLSDELQLEILVTPPQSELPQITIETIVDTTGKAIVSDLKVEGDGSRYVASFSKNQLVAGLYKMKVVADENSEVLAFKVVTPVAIASAKLNDLELSFGEKIQNQLFSSGSGDALRVQVAVQSQLDQSPVMAHQAFLRFTHLQDKIDTYFVLTPDASKKSLSTQLHFGTLSKKFSYKSGDHQLQVIVGDPTFERGLVWDLGTVELLLGAAPPQAPSPLYAKPLLHESDTTLSALPEIKHVMRPQDPRPPIAVSLAFSAAVAAPFVFFLLFVLQLRLNVSKLFHGANLVFGLGFLASLAAIFALFAWYWIELTMYTTLSYLGVLGSVALWLGHLTLKRLANAGASHKTKHD